MTSSLRVRLGLVLAALLAVVPLIAAAGSPAQARPGGASAERAAVVVTGNVVWVSNGRPVSGVTVYAYRYDGRTRLGSDVTDRYGRFTIRTPRDDEEFGIYVQGRRVGYAAGWVGCDMTLKPSFGAACTHSAEVGKVRIRRA